MTIIKVSARYGAIALAAICFAAPLQAAELQDITVLMPAPPTLPAFAPWTLAQHRGYFEKEGLNLNFVAANGGAAEVAKQVGAGNAPFGSGAGDVPIFVRANGIPVKDVATLGGRSLMQVAVWADDATINKPQDLKGKTITAGSYQDGIYYAFLGMISKVGLTKGDVDVEAAGPTGVWQLFAAHKADAMISTPDWTALAEGAGAKVKLLRADEYFPSIAMSIYASDDTIRNKPKLVAAVVSPVLRMMKEIMADPQAAAREFLVAVPAMKDNAAFVSRVIESYAQNVFPGQKRVGEIDGQRLKGLQDFYLQQKLVETAVPLDELYTNQFIQ
jgi:NitT/TauT family transport system substrate-binding protein